VNRPEAAPFDADDVRRRLRERADELALELAAVAPTEAAAGAHEVGDLKDQAASEAEEQVVDAGAERDLAELRAVTAALQRLDDGRYGLCVDCGEPIDAGRLRAQPAAPRCIACQRSAELHPT
jgi:DnaK suppressor protein